VPGPLALRVLQVTLLFLSLAPPLFSLLGSSGCSLCLLLSLGTSVPFLETC